MPGVPWPNNGLSGNTVTLATTPMDRKEKARKSLTFMRHLSYIEIMVSRTNMKEGRVNQKLRTRQALLAAAWDLLRQGKQPTIDEVAGKAMISRATAYRYFPNRERLLIEAVLNREVTPVEKVLDGIADDSAVEAVGRVQQHLYTQVTRNETLNRSLLRACQDEWMSNKNRFVLRGDQRLPLLKEALRRRRKDIEPRELENLYYALAAMVGLESYIVLRDVCQVSQSRGNEIMSWAVRKLVEAVLK